MKSKIRLLAVLAVILGCGLILNVLTGCTGVFGVEETGMSGNSLPKANKQSTTEIKPEPTQPKSQDSTAELSTEATTETEVKAETEKPKEQKPRKTPPLEAVKTEEKYEEIANTFIQYNYGGYYEILEDGVTVATGAAAPFAPAPVVEESPAMESAAADNNVTNDGAANSDYSNTNVQVVGVDEADLIKTDGKYIYYCMDDTLFVVETDNKGEMKSVASETYSNFSPFEMYLDGDYLVVIGNDNNTRNKSDTAAMPEKAMGTYYVEPYISVKIYERFDGGKINLARTVSLDGGYLTSRKIGQSVYIITNSWRYSNIIPAYIDTAVSSLEYDVPLDCMYIMPDYVNNSVMMVATIDLSDSSKKVDIQSFVGSADIVYMSKDALYVSFSRWSNSGYGTQIYKFALESDYVTYESNGLIQGQLLNQFSMDEYEGYLRVAVTNPWNSKNNTSSNTLYILDANLKEVSKIDEIAPGERIYSVRFMGGRGYVVTFRQTDPLFAFDLSDPKNPKLLGALKIPGYSTYLHPYDENHLIGFGQDTVETKNGAVLSTGIKISMFDVTDLTNPTELFVTYIGDRGSTSPLLYNHKAILQNTAKNIFAFPASEYRIQSKNKDEWTYGSFYQQGAFVYNIDMEKGFELRGVISHKTDEELLKSGMYYNGNYETDVERIIYIGDYFYTVSRSKIQSSEIDSLKPVSQLTVGKSLS